MSKHIRCLRTYRRVADKDHSCCRRCHLPIFAGESYLAEVFVFNGHLWTKKYHDYLCESDDEERVQSEVRHKQIQDTARTIQLVILMNLSATMKSRKY